PTATARARSGAAAWSGTVAGGGNALFTVRRGLVGVDGVRGPSVLLNAGERVEADLAGLHEPTLVPTPARARRDAFADEMRRELAEDLADDAPQRAVSAEERGVEHQLGRVLTDASGDRVRAEEFVVRTGADSFAFVALNSRAGGGLSYYSWRGTFDRALPTDLSPVFEDLPGTAGAAAPWTLTAYTMERSNGADTLTLSAAGGHQVDVNSNSDPLDDVSSLFDPAAAAFRSVSGPVYETIFDKGGLYADGTLKRGWTGSNLQSQNDQTPASTTDPLTGAALASSLPSYTSNSTFPDAASARRDDLESYSDGTQVLTENVAVSPGGGAADRGAFGGAASGAAWQAALLRQGFEQTTTASGFRGAIDVLVSPRALIETGAAK
ncbi:MAG: hypothetical protein KGM24_12430, partial [Elusimicrobia bacterium]|nr:hypothetical protein [Elusimicrobiota bacterium]